VWTAGCLESAPAPEEIHVFEALSYRAFEGNLMVSAANRLLEPLIFMLGVMMTILFAVGATLMVRDFRRSDQANKRRTARRSLYAKPRVIDIDPNEDP